MTQIDDGAKLYEHCSQNFYHDFRVLLPGRQPGQEGNDGKYPASYLFPAVLAYGNFILLFLTIIFILKVRAFFFGKFTKKWFKWLNDSFKTEDQEISFSDADGASLYIPQVMTKVYPFPLLACRLDNIPNSMIDWHDPLHEHSFYDLQRDAETLVGNIDISDNIVFSRVAYWPNIAVEDTDINSKHVDISSDIGTSQIEITATNSCERS